MKKRDLIILACTFVILASLFNLGYVLGAWLFSNNTLTLQLHPKQLLFIFAAISVFFVLKSIITREKLKRTG